MILVVDSSVACKWFVDEPMNLEAKALLSTREFLIAPDLVIAEVCNIAWKKVRSGEIDALQAMAMMERVGDLFDELVPCAELGSRAFAIADVLGHPAYDCFYLALVEARGGRFVTADNRLLVRLAGTRWEGFASPLVPGMANA